LSFPSLRQPASMLAALLKEWGVEPPRSRRALDADGLKTARRLAGLLADKVDEIMEAD